MRNDTVQIPILIILTFSLGGVTGCNPPTTRLGKIVGSSMSPTLCGKHYEAKCPGCKIQFSFDAEQADKRATVICPNCGTHAGRELWIPIDADPVTIVANSEINRWDIIAFERNQSMGATLDLDLMTKRVVGLPGESIRFENGNIIANQVLVRKPLPLQKQMRVLVCDSKFQTNPSSNWILTPENNWESTNGFFQLRSPSPEGQIDWFDFRYQRNYFRNDVKPFNSALEDFYGYNQSLSRKLNLMEEVFVEINIQHSDGIFGWRFGNQNELYEFQINEASSEIQIYSGRPDTRPLTKLHTATISTALKNKIPTRIEFSSFDRVLRVVVNGIEIWTLRLNAASYAPQKTVLSFGGNSTGARIQRIRIWRDIYYFDADATSSPAVQTKTGFFVIGDNVPLSHDSRHWKQQGVAIESVKGKVFPQ